MPFTIGKHLVCLVPSEDPESIIELARKADADSKCDEYLEAMGGDDCARKNRPIRRFCGSN